jgi:uncharacterized protein (TIGR00297 family)
MRVPQRLLAGLMSSGFVSACAVRSGSLSGSGGAAATLVGAIAFASGWPSTRALLAFFATSSALSHLRFGGRDRAPRRTARQVLANGGVAAAAWTAGLLGFGGPWDRLAAGSLAAAAADTWATEIGQRYGGVPRLITSGRPVQPGESGGITLVGTLAAMCGALVVALSESSLRPPLGIIPGGLLAALADSLLGASVQARYTCRVCSALTEQSEHCGRPGELISGYAWITNDAVNALTTLIGGLVCVGLDHQSR